MNPGEGRNSNDFFGNINNAIEEEVIRRTEDLQRELTKTTERLVHYREKYESLKDKHEVVEKDYEKLKELNIVLDTFNKDNVEGLFELLNLKTTKHIDFDGMDTEKIPLWFKMLTLYYPDKEKVLSILDIFDEKYPKWAKTFKLPFDYNEDELDKILNNLGKMYVTNGKHFSSNMGFFYSDIRISEGNIIKRLSRVSYVAMPWNLFLQNPLLTTEKYMNKIEELLSNKGYDSIENNFYAIQKYQDINPEFVDILARNISHHRYSDTKKQFLNKNKDILKKYPKMAEKFKSRMREYNFSEFYYLNFPVNMQKEFLKDLDGNPDEKLKLILKMEATKEEKVELIKKIYFNSEDKTNTFADLE